MSDKSVLIEMIGLRFGRLMVVDRCASRWSKAHWRCQCDCGNWRVVSGTTLRTGKQKSCGCLSIEHTRERSTKHGNSPRGGLSPEYSSWQTMRGRCNTPANKDYHYYGARGIKVCDEWQNDFPRFLEDMGRRPSAEHSLDRINNSLGYSKENCQWRTHKEQMRNTRRNRIVILDGQQMPLAEAAERAGVNYATVQCRLSRGRSEEDALQAIYKDGEKRNMNADKRSFLEALIQNGGTSASKDLRLQVSDRQAKARQVAKRQGLVKYENGQWIITELGRSAIVGKVIAAAVGSAG